MIARSAERFAERPDIRGQRPERAARVARSARKSVAVRREWTSFAGRGQSRKVTRGSETRIREMRGRDMRAVIAYARSQVGKRYVRGGAGPGGFDCSGLTKRAFAKAGLRLPHSSGGQARRARAVSRSSALPGDLVVGRGHVGIYMGKGMMIDAGNSRTGVVYRKVYDGLSVSRLG
ncbi:C40 family peptidase [Actinoplanes derwentensis]|uniref:C40 family peptidase n=1 Tax=Actinoplanes derwentensis TaxID=113562 RepID=UPI001E6285BF|nr:NlpC/P60 family protein [Actinoplanes derwentensis]